MFESIIMLLKLANARVPCTMNNLLIDKKEKSIENSNQPND